LRQEGLPTTEAGACGSQRFLISFAEPAMGSKSPCPDSQGLQRYLLGQVNDPEAEQIERHLSECRRCLTAVASLPAEDHLVQAMHAQAAGRREPPSAVVAELMRRLSRLRPPAAATEAPPTSPSLAPATITPGESVEDVYDFLAPAQEPGELGRLGGYRVLRVLGAGGMGVVFAAEDLQLRRPVALKAMRPSLANSASALQRFLREARAVAALTHDHIVTVYQVGEDRGVFFLAMQLLQGEALEACLQRKGALSLAEVLRIGREIAEGLAAAHERGLIHRDIKPGNIWLEAGTNRVKLLDFGLVREMGDSARLTREGAIVGTPAYMAPEQARGEALDPRCDLFSLGCVLYRACTGVVPFQAPDPVATLVAIATDKPLPARERNSGVPPRLSLLIEQLLAKSPGDRPASARAVAEALAALAAGSGPQEHRPPVRRRWLLGVALTAAACGLLALMSYGLLRPRLATQPAPLATSPTGVPTSPNPVPIAREPRELLSLKGHTDIVDCVAFLPDGRHALSGGWDRTVRLWDLETGQQQFQFPEQAASVHCLAVSADGKLALAAGGTRRDQAGDYTIHLLKVETGEDWKQFHGHKDKVVGLAFLSGTRFLSLSWDHTLRLWDWQTGKQVESREQAARSFWSPSLSGNGPGVVRLWDLAAGKVMLRRFRERNAEVDCLAFTPDGERLLVGGTDQIVTVWDVSTDTEEGAFRGHMGRIWSVAVSPDSKRALTGSLDKTMRLWEVATGKELHVFTGHSKGVQCVAFSPDGQRALSASGDTTVRLWQLP
jgi:anti-sigma factor RsiW